MKKMSFSKRVTALLMTVIMVIGLMPNVTLPTNAAEQAGLITVEKVSDLSSFDNWEDYYGDNSLLPDGTRGISTWKAGGVWTDKSVYSDSTAFPSSVTMDNQANNFLVALSALASNKEIVGQSSAPTDSFLVLDVSGSMDDNSKAEGMVEAANRAIHSLMAQNRNNRVGVMLYSGTRNDDGETATTLLLPLEHYTTTSTVDVGTRYDPEYIPAYLTISDDSTSPDVGIASGVRYGNNQRPASAEREVTDATYIQRGLYDAWKEFEKVTDVKVPAGNVQAGIQRSPVIILMSDGRPTLATDAYNNVGLRNSAYGNGSNDTTSWETVFLTQLTAAWVKGAVADHYGTDANLYTLGLGTSNDSYATSVLDPSDTRDTDVLTWWRNFINGTKRDDGTVEIVAKVDGSGWPGWPGYVPSSPGWYLPYDTDRFAANVGRSYSDGYWSANDVTEMINAFQEIVDEIGLQSAYSATLVEKGEADLDGYITVQDELGAMMQVKDVKGILLGSTLFSGEEMAKSLNEGALGSADTPTAYGDEFVRTVKERLGLTDKVGASGETITATAQAQQLINAAYEDMQLSYNATTGEYSNYIGWYGDANNAYLGFWDKDTGVTATGAPEGAKYINKSYGYLGGTSTEEGAADMMHIVVMVRTEITTGHQTVLFKIPSSLIPMVEYKVELEGDSLETATSITLTVNEADPIRLVYEAGLPDDVNSINIDQKVAEFEATSDMKVHRDAAGNYLFYANSWDTNNDGVAPNISALTDREKLDITQYLPESHFIPNTVNERFYIQEDSVVYTKNGNNYTPVTNGINPNGTYYFARTIVTIVDRTAKAVTQYEQLQPATVAVSSNFQRNGAGQWEVKAGTIRQQLSNVILPKTDENEEIANPTGTLPNTDQLWVNVTSSDPSDYNIYSFLGNNGKLTVAPATGIKVTKNVTELADGASANEEFPIIVTINDDILDPVVTDVDGNLLTDYTSRVTLGKTEVILNLADGESAVISGLPAGVSYTVSEAAHNKYTASCTGATATVANTIVENLVTNKPTEPGGLFITKEVVHAHAGETFPTDYEFKFEVTFVDANGDPIVGTFQLENNYDPTLTALPTDENGVMTGYLCHGETVYIKNIPAGTTVTVNEVELPVNGNYTLSGYRSHNFSDGPVDTDGIVTIVPGANATVVVTNTYTPKETTVNLDLDIEKILRVDTQPTESMYFRFGLEEWNGTEWERIVTYQGLGWGASQIKPGQDNVVTGNMSERTLDTFTEAGTYTYRVYEIYPEDPIPGMTYDRTIYTITVTVTDVNGQLVAVITDQNGNILTDTDQDGYLEYTASFTNEAHTAPVSIDIVKDVDDKSNNPLTSKAGFQFVAKEAQSDWTVKENGTELTVTSDGAGKARMTATYKEPGQYYYIVSEVVPDPVPKGWTDFSDAEYRVTVTVERDNTGDLVANMTIVAKDGTTAQGESASVSGNSGTVIFKNTYSPTGVEVDLDVKPTVAKNLKNRTLQANEFTFAIFENGNSSFTDTTEALLIGTNDANGHISFAATQYGVEKGLVDAQNDTLKFSAVGKYEFDIVEIKGNLGGVTYDSTIFDLVVEITDDGSGALQEKHYFEDSVGEQVTFQNTYTAEPTEVVIQGIKSIQVNSGVKTLTANMFTFGLYENGVKKAETKNLANGSFIFDAIEYDLDDAGKTFTYTVREIAPDGSTDGSYAANGMDYSGQAFTVTVKVNDNGDGTLSAVVTGNGTDNIRFVNVYESSLASMTLNGVKTLEGRDLTASEYQFALYESNADFTEKNAVVQQNGLDYVTNDADGEFTLSINNLGMGYHYYILSEMIPEERAAGISYDASTYHITVQVSDSGNGRMSAITTIYHSGQHNVIDPNNITFKNIYRPDDTAVIINGEKLLEGGKPLQAGDFSFELYNGTTLLDEAQLAADGTFSFDVITYTADDIGTHTYTVKEKIPDNATENGNGKWTLGTITYDATEYTVVVTVSDDDKDGALEIAKTVNGDAAAEIIFTNVHTPVSIPLNLAAQKKYNKDMEGGEFTFTLEGEGFDKQEKTNDAQGNVVFDTLQLTEAKTYTFTVKEKEEILWGFITWDKSEYTVTVTVENQAGVLVITDQLVTVGQEAKDGGIIFTNKYNMTGEDQVVLSGTKTLTGDRTTVNAGEFAFGLFDANGQPVCDENGDPIVVTNDASGSFTFPALKFTEADTDIDGVSTYTYTVKEIAGNNTRYTYDNTIYTVTVTVKDNDQGGIDVSHTITENGSDAEIVFENTYTNPAPVTYTPMAKKNYNKTLNGGEFKFKLEGEINGTPVSQEKTNAAGGSITFDTLSFPEAGIYTFTVKEIDKLLGFIEYSEAEYTLVVNIIDTNGVLSLGSVAVGSDPDEEIVFTNTYVIDGEDEITLRGTKTLTGGRTTFEANEFEFGLYDQAGELIESVKNDADGNFAFTTLKFDESDVPVSGQKQITYTVKEIAGSDIRVTYDETVYTVVVTVKDNEEGGVTASYTVNSEDDGLIAFTNIYTPKPEDITVDLDIIKKVVNKGSEKIGPEGFEFLLNALADGVADITVKSDENGKAKFTLSFTEEDIGNTYTYKLTEVNGGKANVTYSDAEYTITVTIALNENNQLVATLTKNSENVTAVVAEFENVYNYTPSIPENPQTGDNTRIHLWFALLFVSSGAIVTLIVCDKKRRIKESE